MAEQKLRKITNPGSTMLSFNFDTKKNNKRESGILVPRQIMTITEEQFNSREVQKLRKRGLIVDMTACSCAVFSSPATASAAAPVTRETAPTRRCTSALALARSAFSRLASCFKPRRCALTWDTACRNVSSWRLGSDPMRRIWSTTKVSILSADTDFVGQVSWPFFWAVVQV